MSNNPRLLIVSNRLPVSLAWRDDVLTVTDTSGGLATGLKPYHEGSGGLWVGWPGEDRGTGERAEAADEVLRARRIAPVWLSRDQVHRYYNGFANRVLWPSFHYLIDRVPVDPAGWEAYAQVNAKFADAVAREYRTGDLIWVHDYQLMLLPALLRERLPQARIGFFLHIPFPSSEVFRILPWRAQILNGLLGADVIGMHTFAYVRHFLASLVHVLGIEADVDRVRVDGRDVHVGAFPMGIDAARFETLAATPHVRERADALRQEAGGRRIVLGIDRLDYTKGIPRRLAAVERLFETRPEWRDRLRYTQVAVPSRGEVDSYRRFKRNVEEQVGRINGDCGSLACSPVHYLHQSVPPEDLVALYLAADAMLVTPLRDGMNLVAKEFVASRPDGDGVLILSEFAGAAAELDGAMTVNPYDVDGVAESLHRALTMPIAERKARMRTMRSRVVEYDVHRWARAFVDRLTDVPVSATALGVPPQPSLLTVVTEAQARGPLRLLLDYDGTLVPLARSPELAAPDDEVLGLLESLAATPGIRVDLVSGRPRECMETWFRHLPIALWAEHGFWRRPSADRLWTAAARIAPDWTRRLRPVLDQFSAATPGAFTEVKAASLAWHYRRARREFGARQAHELRMLLGETLSNQPLEVIEGNKVIEIRLRGVSKAMVAHHVRETDPGAMVLAIGDDASDDDMFQALSGAQVTVSVGPRASCANYRVDDYRAVRRLLRVLTGPASAKAPSASIVVPESLAV